MTELASIIQQLNKKYGENTINLVSKMKNIEVERLSSGSLALDYVLGKSKEKFGWPFGRVVELYGHPSSGKSLISLLTIKEAQQNGYDCIYLDCENGFDPEFAKKLGVDVNKLIVSQVSVGEDVIDILTDILKSKEKKVIVVDSVASMVATKEMEESIEQQNIALKARLMSRALAKITALNKSALIIFINQIRVNVGCFNYNQRVSMADGTAKKIGSIVNRKLKDKILSLNMDTNKIEETPILNWFDNGKAEYFLQIITEKNSGNGRSQISCTPEHDILVSDNHYKEAKNLRVGDKVVQLTRDYLLSDQQKEFIIGSLLGDGCLRKIGSKYQYRETHAKEQNNYLEWKANFFGKKKVGRHVRGGKTIETFISKDFEEFYKGFYKDGKKRRIMGFRYLTPLALAIWYQDDGWIQKPANGIFLSTDCFTYTSVDKVSRYIRLKYGLDFTIKNKKGKDGKRYYQLYLSAKQVNKFYRLVEKYIHPSMAYKFGKYYKPRNKKSFLNEHETERFGFITGQAEIIKIEKKPKTRSMKKFDIETKNHNYIADGIIVHNSYGNPEITTGGKALGHYASIRVEVRMGEPLKEKDKQIGQVVKFKVKKNKTANPFGDGYFKFYYDGYIDKTDELVTLGLLTRKISQEGAMYEIVGEKIRGRESLEEKLKSDSKFFDSVKKEVMSK